MGEREFERCRLEKCFEVKNMAGWYAIVKVQFDDKEIKTIGVCLDNAYSMSRKEATRVILEELLPQASERIAKKE